MSESPGKKLRRLEIKRLRMEGKVAFEAGKSSNNCPYGSPFTPNAGQWLRGYREAELNLKETK